MEHFSLCRECGKVYKPVVWFNPLDFCKSCQTNLMEYYARQMRLLQFVNKPKLIYPKRDNEKT